MPNTVPGQWHPHELFLCAVCVLTGVTGLVTQAAPGSIREALPLPLVWTWAAVLITSGGAILATWLFVRDRVSARIIERLALVPMGIMLTVYGFAAVTAVGPAGLLACGMSVTLAIANAVRVRQITRWLKVQPRRSS